MKRKAILLLAVVAIVSAGCTTSKPRTQPTAPVYEHGNRSSDGSEYFEEGTAGIDSPDVTTGSGEYQSGDLSVAQASAPTTAPVAEQAGTVDSGGAPVVRPTPQQEVAMVSTGTSTASMSSAASSLASKAEEQQRSGDLTGAASTLERALRIDPQSALLWNRLANVRLEQRRYALASELASKSNAFAGSDKVLKRNNWLIISSSRSATGDSAGAEAARQRANALR